MSIYRIEHRTASGVVIVGHSDAADASQAELSELAGRLMLAGETGELVLVEEATGEEVARRQLRVEDDDPA
ncbi:MAG: hypothetical protein QOF33_1936 [Thermomicrobiales bacterium]|jgi:nitrate reductase NapAB chaperone NapD|nr:hypothetical protein [Thermomicrobiales bacterium]MEA2525872.1 hypothetical protein [Thermomicrobiales bacterium]MEA2583851.1 hypothetical protein [Thermomicrobiales bacterium]MEA2598704.1 hypothetical protein [Thermomicrobiales bacterium]